MNKNLSAYDLFVHFVSLISYLVDTGSDIALVVIFFLEGNTVWGSLTLGFVALATFLMQIFSFIWHATDGTLNWKTFFIHILFLAPIHRYIDVLRFGFKARHTRKLHDLEKVFRANNDVCLLRLIESFAESAPQLILQLYMILRFQHFNWVLGISTVFSLTSIAWSMTAYTDGLRLAFKDSYNRKWLSIMIYTASQIAMIAARVTAIVVFATVFQAWIFLPMGIHWIVMTFWITLQNAEFGQTACEKRLFNAVSGLIYIFCFINLKDDHARWRLLAYHIIMLVENSLLVLLWFLNRPESTPVWMEITTLVIVPGGFTLGGLLLMSYYCCCHPTGVGVSNERKKVVHWFKRLKSIPERPRERILERSISSSRAEEWLHASVNLSTDDKRQEVNYNLNPMPSHIPDILSNSTGMLDTSNNLIFRCSSTGDYFHFQDPSLPTHSMNQEWSHTLDSVKNSYISVSGTHKMISTSVSSSEANIPEHVCHENKGYQNSPVLSKKLSTSCFDSKHNDTNRKLSSSASSVLSLNSERAFAVTGVYDTSTFQHSSVSGTSDSYSLYTSREISPLDANKLWEESQNRLKIQENLSKSWKWSPSVTKVDSFYASPEFIIKKPLSTELENKAFFDDNRKDQNELVQSDDSSSRHSLNSATFHQNPENKYMYILPKISSNKMEISNKYDGKSCLHAAKCSIDDPFLENHSLESCDNSVSCLNVEPSQSDSQVTKTLAELSLAMDESNLMLYKSETGKIDLGKDEVSGLSNFFGDISSVNQTHVGRSRFWSSSTSSVNDSSLQSKLGTLTAATHLHEGRSHLSTSYYEESNAQSPFSPSSYGNHGYSVAALGSLPQPDYSSSHQGISDMTSPNLENLSNFDSQESSVFSSHTLSSVTNGSHSHTHRSDSGLMAGSDTSKHGTSSSDHTGSTSDKNTDDSGYSVAPTDRCPIRPLKLDKFRFASDSQYPIGSGLEEPRFRNARSKSMSSLAFKDIYFRDKLPVHPENLSHAYSTPYLLQNCREISCIQEEEQGQTNHDVNSSGSRRSQLLDDVNRNGLSEVNNNPSELETYALSGNYSRSLLGLSYLLSDEDSLRSTGSRLGLMSRKPIADTPWKSDYCENQPVEFETIGQPISVRFNPQDSHVSLPKFNANKRTPVKVEDLAYSPQRFGRNIDLFKPDIWRASLEGKKRASSLAFLAVKPNLVINDYDKLTQLNQSPYKFRSRKNDCNEYDKPAFDVPEKSNRKKSDLNKENHVPVYLNLPSKLNANEEMVTELTESPYKFGPRQKTGEKGASLSGNLGKIDYYSASENKENVTPKSRTKQKRRSKRRLSSPGLSRKNGETLPSFSVSNSHSIFNTILRSGRIKEKKVNDVLNPCYMYSDTDDDDDRLDDKLTDITFNSSTSSDDNYCPNHYFTFLPKSAEDLYQTEGNNRRMNSRSFAEQSRPVLRSLENTPGFSPIQMPDIVGSNKIQEKVQPVISTPKYPLPYHVDFSNAETFVVMTIQNDDSTVQV